MIPLSPPLWHMWLQIKHSPIPMSATYFVNGPWNTYSHSQISGPCCDPMTCSHRSADYSCRPGDECAFAARCRNLRGFANYQCPGRVKKGNYKPCATESQVCLDGICSNSVCRRYGLTECQCSNTKFQCYVCCNFLNRCEPALHIPKVSKCVETSTAVICKYR